MCFFVVVVVALSHHTVALAASWLTRQRRPPGSQTGLETEGVGKVGGCSLA